MSVIMKLFQILKQKLFILNLEHQLIKLSRLAGSGKLVDYLKKRNCEGDRGEPKECPIAMYLEEIFNKEFLIDGYRLEMFVDEKSSNTIKYVLPKDLQWFITDFDAGLHPSLIKTYA